MTTEDSEGELRARVQEAVGALPGPDQGRLAAIEHRLPGRRRSRPWLVPLLLGIGLAGAAAAGWYAISGPNTDDGASHGPAQSELGPNPVTEPGAPSGQERGTSEQSERQGLEGSDSNRDTDAIIYQK